jgi:hypothetical protein
VQQQLSDEEAAAFGREVLEAARNTSSPTLQGIINDGGVILEASDDDAAAAIGRDALESIIGNNGGG